jgi:two-component system cell cycle response regulator
LEILIAEDDEVSRRLLQATLERWGYQVKTCVDGNEAWEIIEAGQAPKLMILDWMMPGIDGVELCSRIRRLGGNEYVYIILLTAKVQKEDVVTGLAAGADDYITKPFNKQELQLRLRAGRRILDLQEQLLAVQEKLREEAVHDPLTGLFNRRIVEETLEAESDRSSREGTSLSIVMLDIDNFKRVNDTLGHLAGDSVLREIAVKISNSVRTYDVVARYGGEEFLMILPGCSGKEAYELAERVRRRIADEIMDTSEGMIAITASLGIVTTKSGVKLDSTELIAAVDAAMYKAKANGRNRVEVSEL